MENSKYSIGEKVLIRFFESQLLLEITEINDLGYTLENKNLNLILKDYSEEDVNNLIIKIIEQ